MECFERGIITEKDTGGLKLNFGNAQAMVQLVEMIARKEGLGKVLAEGVARAASVFGKKAEEYAMHIKGQELPMHEPRFKQGLGLGYTVSPTGADHCHNIHDPAFTERATLGDLETLGVLEPLPARDLGAGKVKMLVYFLMMRHLGNCLGLCYFVPLSISQQVELVKGITGWNTTVWELMKVGERVINMTRAFNIREGMTKDDDYLPRRFFVPFTSGPLKGVGVNETELAQAIDTYYAMMGWDKNGVPTLGKLQELGIEWVAGVIK